MNRPTNCPFGCTSSKQTTLKCRCKVEKTSQGTQTSPVFDDFDLLNMERQYLAHMIYYARYKGSMERFRADMVLRQRFEDLQEVLEERQAARRRQQELQAQPLDAEDREPVAENREPIADNREQPQNLAVIQQPQPEAQRQQPQELIEEHEPEMGLIDILPPEVFFVENQPPQLDLAERQRIQNELIQKKRPRFDLAVGEQPPEVIFEQDPNQVIDEEQQLQDKWAEGHQSSQNTGPDLPLELKEKTQPESVEREEIEVEEVKVQEVMRQPQQEEESQPEVVIEEGQPAELLLTESEQKE